GQRRELRDQPERMRRLRQLSRALAAVEERPPAFPLQIAATSLLFRRGNVVEQNGRLVATGEQGTLLYGPYIKMLEGTYELHWTGRPQGSTGELLFSVRAGSELVAFARVAVQALPTRASELVRLPFALDRTRYEVELVVEATAGTQVALDHVVV